MVVDGSRVGFQVKRRVVQEVMNLLNHHRSQLCPNHLRKRETLIVQRKLSNKLKTSEFIIIYYNGEK